MAMRNPLIPTRPARFIATGARNATVAIAPGPIEELFVTRVRAGVAALDVVDAQLVELARDLELIVEREGESFALDAVAESGVVEVEARGQAWVSRCV